ncbi:glutathione S-transferase [Leucosporidium creatinivorum]|uniref:Glutathione S-transferase n=1 Tax=Leucosporidium creatinivorum TaxID=106004 RepID=A0A1Y2G131_9BASI|nr:glutathione S-transferase [Leucosporidium creatinivorum]
MSTSPAPSSSGIDLYSFPTPNGLKATIAFEELKSLGVELNYTLKTVDITKERPAPPGERDPAAVFADRRLTVRPIFVVQIVDHDRRGLKIWESGAIYLYLARHYDIGYALHFEDEDEEDEMHSWLFLANAGLAGKGGTIWELSFLPTKQPAAARATIAELKRLYGVYESRLAEDGGRDYLVGVGKGKLSYADLAAYPWFRAAPVNTGLTSFSAAGFPHVAAWMERIEAREGVKKGIPKGEYINQLKSPEGWEETLKKSLDSCHNRHRGSRKITAPGESRYSS